MVALTEATGTVAGDRRLRARRATLALVGLVLVASWAALATGAAGVSLPQALGRLVTGAVLTLQEQVVLWEIRLPRLVTGLCVGAVLAVSGAC